MSQTSAFDWENTVANTESKDAITVKHFQRKKTACEKITRIKSLDI